MTWCISSTESRLIMSPVNAHAEHKADIRFIVRNLSVNYCARLQWACPIVLVSERPSDFFHNAELQAAESNPQLRISIDC